MRKPVSPCTRECAARTTTCKFDGSCEKYQEYAVIAKEYRDLVSKNKGRDRGINGFEIDRTMDVRSRRRRK